METPRQVNVKLCLADCNSKRIAPTLLKFRCMKKFLLFTFVLFLSLSSLSQTGDPVNWKVSYTSISATEGELIIHATIDKNWHIYSQRPTDAGPIPTSFSFSPSKQYSLLGKTEENNAHEEFDKAFDAKIFVFNDKAEFKQKIKLNSKASFSIPFKVEFMCCNDMMCLPPKTIELSVKVQ